jgi:hypothetical protein
MSVGSNSGNVNIFNPSATQDTLLGTAISGGGSFSYQDQGFIHLSPSGGAAAASSFQLTAGFGSNVNTGNFLSAPNVSLSTSGTGKIDAGFIDAASLSLSVDTGDISLSTNAAFVSVTNGGNVSISDSKSASLTVTAPLSLNILSFFDTATGGLLTFNGSVNISNSVSFTAGSLASTGIFGASQISLTANTGNISSDGTLSGSDYEIGSSTGSLLLNAQAVGLVKIYDPNTSDSIILNNLSTPLAASNFQLRTAGSVNGALEPTTSINSPNIYLSGQNIQVSNLSSGGGTLQLSVVSTGTANIGVDSTGVNLVLSPFAEVPQAATQFSLTSAGSIVSSLATAIASPVIILTANSGNIGASNAPLVLTSNTTITTQLRFTASVTIHLTAMETCSSW